MVLVTTLFSLFTVSLCRSIPRSRLSSSPYTHASDLKIHDPTVIEVDGTYYSYGVGEHIVIHEAPHLAGPWKQVGSVLDKDSIIPKGDRAKPWAPTTVEVNGTFYCYYSVSNAGCRDSAIGVATSQLPGPGGWTDHGAVVQSGTGPAADQYPFNEVNAIDPAVLVTEDMGYLIFGSYWSGIWEVPLSQDLVSAGNASRSNAHHLAKHPQAARVQSDGENPDPLCREPSGRHPVEGAYMTYRAPYYYLWLSWGTCCDYDPNNLPPPGEEYSIRVGRSQSPHGPFVDKQGEELTHGGGELIYGSNNDVYAPGGQGVIAGEFRDILYYHYLNTSISYDFWEAWLGYSYLGYVDGWPIVLKSTDLGML
ncbi:arabinan endo-1,5-alpha-L-arabinosidase [Aspergillus alliaceus]|uniref:arabinan endo-1,5-alpha-L-arabinosidase n=1 Tax=Petromyces alliaceus TaxID=209559 RepID=UPI0012A5107C|nr:putative arabinan endo-1,5-alpha-L-arabinosidase B [Aspergillus alliaceus]KAB8238118.1 putative arabinan endo-1,5-alpha-L-arabinosidase B [Aspergillus alliaceus]